MDLGYFKKPVIPCVDGHEIIGIGHSIGLSKLITSYHHIEYLIGLNAFVHFLGHDQEMHRRRRRECEVLRLHFLRNPVHALQQFYVRCGASALIPDIDFSRLDLDHLLLDFDWLQKEYLWPLVPTLIINARDDVIVPSALIMDNMSTPHHIELDMMSNGGHALGLNNPLEIYQKIMSFLP